MALGQFDLLFRGGLALGGIGRWQMHFKARAFADLTVDIEETAMALDDAEDRREAQARFPCRPLWW